MDVDTLAARLDDVHVVDVREPGEWDAGHIERARHIPGDVLADNLHELDRSRLVVTVCRSGSRSSDAARRLVAEGFRAQSLDGGMLAWEEAGLDVVASDGTPGRVLGPGAPADDGSEGYPADRRGPDPSGSRRGDGPHHGRTAAGLRPGRSRSWWCAPRDSNPEPAD